MFKKITQLSMLLLFVLVMGLAACSGQTESEPVLLEPTTEVIAASTDDTIDAEVEEAEVIELEPTTEVITDDTADVEVEEAELEPTIEVNASTGDATYVVDTAVSTVGWMGDKIVGDSHNGIINISEGALVVENGALVSGSFVIDMTTISSGDLSGNDATRLITHLMAEDFFGVDSYPTATLEILGSESLGNDQYAVTGNLTIKDIVNPIVFVVEAVEENGVITAAANIVFDRTLYDITYKSGSIFSGLGDGAINDEIQIMVDLVATT